MKKLILILLVQLLLLPISAQKKGNFGVFAGGSYYMGDLNYSKHFYMVSPAAGVLYRHDFNDRHSAKMNLYYGGLKAASQGDGYRDWIGTQELGSFSSQVLEIAMMYEFNFLPFNTKKRKENFTPYVSAGLGFSMFFGDYQTNVHQPVLPMGLGLRYNINDRMGVGCFWEMRYLFRDDMDRVINGDLNINNPNNMEVDKDFGLNNNDFYNFFGVYLTYKIFEFLEDCPAYEKTSW